jgi:hypothetical protein
MRRLRIWDLAKRLFSAFVELETKGFLKLEKRGNWYSRRARDWRLTTKPMKTARGNDAPTKDWRHWQRHRQAATFGSS